MTDEQLLSQLQKIHFRFIGQLNTPEVQRAFRDAVTSEIGPSFDEFKIVCDATRNPPSVVASNKLGFIFYFKRDGNSYYVADSDLPKVDLFDAYGRAP
jgi:hypothetical protein